MPIKKVKPTSPGRRGMTTNAFAELTKGARPEKSLTVALKKSGGRNNSGRITVRHRGGGHKRKYRLIDWKRDKDGVAGEVQSIQYDPNRSANIALVLYEDGEKRYILAPLGLRVGQRVMSGPDAEIEVGNALALRDIPVGSTVHCIEMKPGKGAQIARAAGAGVQLVAREGVYATLRLRSGEMRRVPSECRATIGEVGNVEHNLEKLGKAGASRWRGVKPTVRGAAMNPVDHPHGGGEGKSKGGRHPVTPWGVPTLGKRTRRKHKESDSLIVRPRRRGKEKR